MDSRNLPPQIAIRQARAGDLPVIASIERRSFRVDGWSEDILADALAESLKNPEKFTLLIAFANATIAESKHMPPEDDIAGYTLGECETEEEGVIESLAVTPEFRGLHLGRALLDRVCHSLRNTGVERIRLEVRAQNETAIGLYKSAGFQKTADLPEFYQPGDAIQMKRFYAPAL